MSTSYTEETILHDITELLEDITSDWDTPSDKPIDSDTRLIEDLAFESIDVVQYIVGIEEKYHRRGMPFEELVMQDGRYVDEITVGETVKFLVRHLNQQE